MDLKLPRKRGKEGCRQRAGGGQHPVTTQLTGTQTQPEASSMWSCAGEMVLMAPSLSPTPLTCQKFGSGLFQEGLQHIGLDC